MISLPPAGLDEAQRLQLLQHHGEPGLVTGRHLIITTLCEDGVPAGQPVEHVDESGTLQVQLVADTDVGECGRYLSGVGNLEVVVLQVLVGVGEGSVEGRAGGTDQVPSDDSRDTEHKYLMQRVRCWRREVFMETIVNGRHHLATYDVIRVLLLSVCPRLVPGGLQETRL